VASFVDPDRAPRREPEERRVPSFDISSDFAKKRSTCFGARARAFGFGRGSRSLSSSKSSFLNGFFSMWPSRFTNANIARIGVRSQLTDAAETPVLRSRTQADITLNVTWSVRVIFFFSISSTKVEIPQA
jgi:hypothetical protein